MNNSHGARKLLMDLGNSGVRWCWATARGLSDVAYRSHRSRSDIAEVLSEALPHSEVPEEVWISSVADPQTETDLVAWLERHWRLNGRFVTAEIEAFGIVNGYREATQLGVDRWLALIGARQVASGDLCVVDAGTAMTVDVLRGDGRHLGGYILPGLGTMRRALLSGTRIPWVEDIECSIAPATDTACAVASGARLALSGVIERAVQTQTSELKAPVRLVLTGSEARLLSPWLSVAHEIHPDLVLGGLAMYALQTESQ